MLGSSVVKVGVIESRLSEGIPYACSFFDAKSSRLLAVVKGGVHSALDSLATRLYCV